MEDVEQETGIGAPGGNGHVNAVRTVTQVFEYIVDQAKLKRDSGK